MMTTDSPKLYFLLAGIVMALMVIIYGPSQQEHERANSKPDPRILVVDASLKDGEFVLENQDNDHWTDCFVVLNDAYEAPFGDLRPGEHRKVHMLQFVDKNANRFDIFKKQPQGIYVYANTPEGSATWEGSFDHSTPSIEPTPGPQMFVPKGPRPTDTPLPPILETDIKAEIRENGLVVLNDTPVSWLQFQATIGSVSNDKTYGAVISYVGSGESTLINWESFENFSLANNYQGEVFNASTSEINSLQLTVNLTNGKSITKDMLSN